MKLRSYGKYLILFLVLFLWQIANTGILKANNYPPPNDSDIAQPLTEVLKEMSETYEVIFSYESKLLSEIEVDFSFRQGESIDNAINRLISQTGLRYQTIGSKYYVIHQDNKEGNKSAKKLGKKIKQIQKLEQKGKINLKSVQSNPSNKLSSVVNSIAELKADRTISGTVTSTDGEPLIGATIAVQGTTVGTTTELDGSFHLNVPDDATTLIVSYTGFVTQEVDISGRNIVTIQMESDVAQLNEVVVSALGISREKKSLGYAVTELDGSSVNTVKESNVASSLAGRVAGVVVYKNTSGVGGASRVIIRGNNSLSGNNEPLYVVDGIPIDNSNQARGEEFEFRVPDFGNGISDINPDDIESISILKGPNAAALYGSRASNGVVLITTKSGAKGKGLGVSISSSSTFETPFILPEYQNEYGRGTDGNHVQINPSDDLATQVQAVGLANSWGPKFDGSNQLEFMGEQRPYSAQPDNVKDFFETGSTLINTIALTGSSDRASFRFSYTRSDLNSILPNSKVERNNFNLRGTAALNDRLSLDAKVTYFLQDAKNRAVQGTEGITSSFLTMPRNIQTDDLKTYQNTTNPINPNDPFRVIAASPTSGNPYWMLHENFNGDNRTRITGFAKLNYKFTDWLSAFVRAGTDDISQDFERIIANGNHIFSSGRVFYTNNTRKETNYDFLIMANKNLGSRLNLAINAGGNARVSDFIESGINGAGFKIPGRYFLDNTTTISASSSEDVPQNVLIKKKVNSLYGSASLSFDNMIYLDVTGRNDWSSALAAENRSFFYSSASLSLLLNEMLDLDETTVDLLKLRASTANVGNDTDPLQITNVFKVAANGYLGNIQINRENIRFSESLVPEDIGTVEAGVEFRLYRNRVYGDFSVYKITTKDLIFDVPVDPGTGYSFFRENIGEITNQGFELLLGGAPVNTSDFRWDISANISRNKNKLVSLIEGQESFNLSSSNDGVVDVRAQVDRVLDDGTKIDGGYGDIYTTTWLRNDAGQLILTAEGRPQATAEREKFGNFQPDFSGGITNTLRYQGFTLNALVDFRIGGEVYANTEAALDAAGVSKRSLEFREGGITVDGVIEQPDGSFLPNTINISAQDYWGAVSGIGSEYVYDQTNIRLRELSLSYSLPRDLLSNIGVGGASISVIGRNLFFLHKKVDNFDPESSYATGNLGQGVLYYSLPTTRSFGFSLNVNF